jgi:hypothetical protein
MLDRGIFNGDMVITGQKENIKKFLDRFIYPEEPNPDAMSTKNVLQLKGFVIKHILRQDMFNKVNKAFRHRDGKTIEFYLQFTTDGKLVNNVIYGFGKTNSTEYISLKEACIDDNVGVEIDTNCNYFVVNEEHVKCYPNGVIVYYDTKPKIYRCKCCGYTYSIPSNYDLSQTYCEQCSVSSWILDREDVESK